MSKLIYAEYQESLKKAAAILAYCYNEKVTYFETIGNSEAAENCKNSAEFYTKMRTWQSINEGMADNIESRLCKEEESIAKQIAYLDAKDHKSEGESYRLTQLEAKAIVIDKCIKEVGAGIAKFSEATNAATMDWSALM